MNIITTQPDGNQLDLDSIAQDFDRTGAVLNSVTITDLNGNYYTQTFTYTSTYLTGTSAWVKTEPPEEVKSRLLANSAKKSGGA